MERDTSTDLSLTARAAGPSRCGHCSGALGPDAPWCTLCLTPTAAAPAPEPVPGPAPEPPAATAGFDPLTAPLELLLASAPHPAPHPARHPAPLQAAHPDPAPGPAQVAAAPAWPCTACSSPNPLDAVACGACGSGFLEQVRRSEGPLLVLPLVGDLSRLDKLQSLMLATAVVVVMLLVTLLAGTLLG